MNEELKAKVESELGQNFDYEKLEKGLNTIYILSRKNKEYILKIHTNPENKIEWFRAEPEIYRVLSEETDIPSPEIVYEDLSEEDFDNAFYVMEKMEGDNPQKLKTDLELDTIEDLVFQYGRILGKIHGIKLTEEYGILGYEKDLSSPEGAEQWNWAIEGSMAAWKEIVEEEWEEPPEIDYDADKVEEELPDRPQSVLLHSDNRLDNILVQDSEITGFLDWSHPWSGHKLYDLARAEYLLIDYDLDNMEEGEKQRLRQKLFEGYKEAGEMPEAWTKSRKRQIYRYTTTLWLAAGFSNWGSELNEEEHSEMRKEIIQRMKDEEQKEFLS